LKKITDTSESMFSRLAISMLAVFTAFLCGAAIIWISGVNAFHAYSGLFEGMFGSFDALVDTCVTSTPYILTGLAVAFGFQLGLFNIGAEGQFYMGAICSVVVGFALTEVPAWLHPLICLAAGFAGAFFWGLIPGYLKARLGAHEVINTIMMNYIAIQFVDYMVKHVIRDPHATVDRTPYILSTARLPKLFGPDFRIHAGFIIALLAVAIVSWVLYRTVFGFSIRTIGANPDAARYAGFRVERNTALVLAVSGGLAGLAGAVEVLGLEHTLPAAFTSGYGYDAIAIAFLARANPIGVVPAAFLWGGLRNGAGLMQVRAGISTDMVNVLLALVIVFIAADPLVRRLCRLKSVSLRLHGWRNK
jgi:simple sugar transport system permease protein